MLLSFYSPTIMHNRDIVMDFIKFKLKSKYLNNIENHVFAAEGDCVQRWLMIKMLDLDFCKCGISLTQNTSQVFWDAKKNFSWTSNWYVFVKHQQIHHKMSERHTTNYDPSNSDKTTNILQNSIANFLTSQRYNGDDKLG